MTLRKKRFYFIVGSLVVLVGVFSVAIVTGFRYLGLELFKKQSTQTTEIIRVLLNEEMMRGGMANRSDLLFKLRAIAGLDSLKVLRGQAVIEQYGPGLPDESPVTAAQNLALERGEVQVETEELGDPFYRVTIPYLADQYPDTKCTSCHQVQPGTVLGAVSIRYSLSSVQQAVLWTILPICGLLLLFSFGVGYFLKRIIDPVIATAYQLQEVVSGAKHGDFQGRVDVGSQDEVGDIALRINELMETLQLCIGRIETDASSLSDFRFSRFADDQLLRTVQIVHEMVGAAHFRHVVEADTRLDDIYNRLRELLKVRFSLKRYALFEVNTEEHALEPIFSEGEGFAEGAPCLSYLARDIENCRTHRSRSISSTESHAEACGYFVSRDDEQDIQFCIPLVLSGAVAGILQVIVTREELANEPDLKQILAAYLHEIAPVIETRRLMRLLKEMALRDPVTGLFNRNYLDVNIKGICARVLRRDSTMGILMLDIDRFKTINDDYGHDIGDFVLAEVAYVLKKAARAGDIAIRMGGEEFLLLLPDTELRESLLVAERVRAMMEDHIFNTPQGELKCTVSIGGAVFPSGDGGFTECLKMADVALYLAKEAGRNRVVPKTAPAHAPAGDEEPSEAD